MEGSASNANDSFESRRAAAAYPGEDVLFSLVLADADGKLRHKDAAGSCDLGRRIAAITYVHVSIPTRQYSRFGPHGEASDALAVCFERFHHGDTHGAELAYHEAAEAVQLAWVSERRGQEFVRQYRESNAQVPKPKLRPLQARAPRRAACSAGRPRARRAATVASSSSGSDDSGDLPDSEPAGDLHRHAAALRRECRRHLPNTLQDHEVAALHDRVAGFVAEVESFHDADSISLSTVVAIIAREFPELDGRQRWALVRLLPAEYQAAVLPSGTAAA